MLPQYRKQFFLTASDDRVVPLLIHTWLHQLCSLADAHNLFHFIGSVIANAKPSEPPLLSIRVHGPACLLEWCAQVRGLQVHDMHLVYAQRRQQGIYTSGDPLGAVGAGRP